MNLKPSALAEPPKQEKEKYLTREQRRFQERLKLEVESTYRQLCDKFLDFFTVHEEPEGQDVINRIQQYSAQWRTYCKRRNLIPSLFPAFDNYANGLLKEYAQSKTDNNGPESKD